jgi:hypothetical protein
MENFQMFRRGKVVLFFAFFLVLLASMFVACRKDLTTQTSDTTASVTEKSVSDEAAIQDAKQWFEKNYATITNLSNKLQPLWKAAFVFKNKIEVPYSRNGKIMKPSLFKEEGYSGKQRLIFTKKGADSYSVYSINYTPNKNYAPELDKINISNYREKKFDGNIAVSNLEFRTLNAYTFTNGKRGDFVKLKRATQVKQRDEVCSVEYIFQGCSFDYDYVCMCYLLTECQYLEQWNCYDDGNCTTCDNDCPGNPQCEDEDCQGDPWCEEDDQCTCTMQSNEIPLRPMYWDYSNKDYISLVLTSMDCKTGNATADLSHNVQESYPGAISFANEFVRPYFIAPIYTDRPNCGKNVTYICHSIVTYNRWVPGNQYLPSALTLHEYKSVNFL